MNSFKAAMFAVIGIGCAVLAACSTGPAMADPPPKSSTPSALEGYRLGTGDEIKVTVFDEKDVSGNFVVDGLGAISMQLIGSVEVKDLTFAEAQKLIETKLKAGYFTDPKVSVEMTKGRPYYILGEVNRAGEYPFTSGLTVLNAVAAAGDFTYRANKKTVVITSANGEEKEVELTSTTAVRPGDRIRIKERFF